MPRNGTEDVYPVTTDNQDDVENIKDALNSIMKDKKRENIKEIRVDTLEKPLSEDKKFVVIQYNRPQVEPTE